MECADIISQIGGERPEEGKCDVPRVTQLVRHRAGCEPQGACDHTKLVLSTTDKIRIIAPFHRWRERGLKKGSVTCPGSLSW